MRDFIEKKIKGLIFDNTQPMSPAEIIVRVTSDDDAGKSLSLSAYNIMIEIPLEKVEDIIKITDMENEK